MVWWVMADWPVTIYMIECDNSCNTGESEIPPKTRVLSDIDEFRSKLLRQKLDNQGGCVICCCIVNVNWCEKACRKQSIYLGSKSLLLS